MIDLEPKDEIEVRIDDVFWSEIADFPNTPQSLGAAAYFANEVLRIADGDKPSPRVARLARRFVNRHERKS